MYRTGGIRDHAIKMTADVLENVLEDYNAVIGRTGGDEFSAIFPVDDEFDPDECVRRIHRYCDELNETSDMPYYLGVSAGCLKVTAIEGVTLRELLTEADIRLYADKKRRRKTVLK